MNLIKRATLHSQNNSDSNCEINLWQVEEKKYEVIFIQKVLKGYYYKVDTKTKETVSLAEAEKIFNRFVGDLKKRGYIDIFHTSDDSMSITQPFFDDVKRKQTILERLENNKPSKWKLERAIWRAGELKIKEATPLLINLLGTGDDLRDYCIVWALGWCGDQSAIAILTELYENSQTPEFVNRIAFEALLKLGDEGLKATLQAELIASLPLELGRLARTSSSELFEEFAVNHSYYFFAVFEKLYQVDNPYIRASILKILRSVPFQANYFRSIRRIFKIAEYRHDAEVFAILAYRFERVLGNFNNDLLTFSWEEEEEKKYQLDKRRVYDDELKKPYPIVAYSYQTQQYLRRRVWRSLKRLGETGDANYITMAVAILLEYSDRDNGVVVRSQFSQWDNYTRDIKQYWDRYADYLTFNHILYSNSPRYIFNSKKWFRRRGCDVDTEITVREEAFPRLWEQYPQALLKLLFESQCLAVHRFAIKVLRDCEDFCTELDINTVIRVVYSSFDVTAAFGFELALQRFDLGVVSERLYQSLENRLFKPLPNSDYFWVQEEHKLFLDNLELIVSLTISPDIKTHQFARKLINSYIFSDETNHILTKRLITQLLALSETEKETAQNIIEILIDKFTPQLKLLEFDVILDLLGDPILEVQELGALTVIYFYNREITSKISYIYDVVSLISIERVGSLSNTNTLQKTIELISALIQNPDKKIRNAIKPIINRLGKASPSLNLQLATTFINFLLASDKYEEFHKDIILVLQEYLQGWKTSISKTINQEYIFRLLNSNSLIAEDLGCLLLELNYQSCVDGFSISDIITLANRKNSAIRRQARQIFLQKLAYIRIDSGKLCTSVQLLESRWIDTHKFACRIFQKELNIEELIPDILIKILESDNKVARNLGNNLLSNYLESIKLQYRNNPNLKIQAISDLMNALRITEKQNIIYTKFIKILQYTLQEFKSLINIETTFKLINAETSLVQELGGIILEQNSDRFYEQLTIREIVELANHDILSIRQAAQRLFSQNLNRLRNNSQEMLEAVRILDAKWEDTREFAYRILKTEFDEKDFTSDILIAICDSTHAEARKIGRDLLTRNFREVDGEEYFLKFSEHPAADMQKFVTNYFENYAANNPQRLKELTPYFITVLSNVNRNRTPKKRVLSFLKAESDKSQEAAKIIGEIISRQSASMATVDKAIAIEIMLKIKKKYRDISLPIELQPVTEERRKSLKTII